MGAKHPWKSWREEYDPTNSVIGYMPEIYFLKKLKNWQDYKTKSVICTSKKQNLEVRQLK